MKIELSAVIPTVQYGNIQPRFEMELTHEMLLADPGLEDKAQKLLEGKIQALWSRYADKPLNISGGNRKLIHCFTGGDIFYDEATHTYTNEAGEKYLSGSEYADKFAKPFDKQRIAEAVAKRDGIKVEDVLAMWELNGKASMEFGSAIHSVLEAFGKYGSESKQPFLKNACILFYDAHKEKAEFEVFIVDHASKRVGQVDRLEILGDKHCRVTDFKSNAEIEKDLPKYWKQLEHYTEVMEANGWKCEPPVIYWFNNNKWEVIEKEKV